MKENPEIYIYHPQHIIRKYCNTNSSSYNPTGKYVLNMKNKNYKATSFSFISSAKKLWKQQMLTS